MKHYYDDVLIMSTIVYLADYIIIMRYILLRDLSLLRQIVLVMNLVVIQMRSILNINVFYQMIKYCLKRKIAVLLTIPIFLWYV